MVDWISYFWRDRDESFLQIGSADTLVLLRIETLPTISSINISMRRSIHVNILFLLVVSHLNLKNRIKIDYEVVFFALMRSSEKILQIFLCLSHFLHHKIFNQQTRVIKV